MSNYIGYRVKVFMQNNCALEGTILYVDNEILKLQNVITNDEKRGIVKELIVKSSDIKDLEVLQTAAQLQQQQQQQQQAAHSPTTPPVNVATPPTARLATSYPPQGPSTQVTFGNPNPASPIVTPSNPLRTSSSGINTTGALAPNRTSNAEDLLLTPDLLKQKQSREQNIPSTPATAVPYRDPAIISMSNMANSAPTHVPAPSGPSPAPDPRTLLSLPPLPAPPPAHVLNVLNSLPQLPQLPPPPFPMPVYNNPIPVQHPPQHLLPQQQPPLSFSPQPVNPQAPPAPVLPIPSFATQAPGAVQTNTNAQDNGNSTENSNIRRHKSPGKHHGNQQHSNNNNGSSHANGGSGGNMRKEFARKDNATFGEPINENQMAEDFDFVGNNARFNKQQVFAEMLSGSPPNSEVPTPSSDTPVKIPKITFKSESGVAIPAITASQCKSICEISEKTGPNQYMLIENAGRSLSGVAYRFLKNKPNAKVVILCGVGCKGAIGICCARHLANHGVNAIICRSRAYQLSDQVTFQRNVYRLTTGKEAQIGALSVEPVDLIIDALVGTGLRGAITGPTGTLIQWANANGAPILSVDVPSGIDATSGKPSGDFIRAHTTMAVALPKTGLTKEKTGLLYLADVGIPVSIYKEAGVSNYTNPFGEQFIIRLQQQ